MCALEVFRQQLENVLLSRDVGASQLRHVGGDCRTQRWNNVIDYRVCVYVFVCRHNLLCWTHSVLGSTQTGPCLVVKLKTVD